MTARLALLALVFIACGGMIASPPIVDVDAADDDASVDAGVDAMAAKDVDGPEIDWGCGAVCPNPPPGLPPIGPTQK